MWVSELAKGIKDSVNYKRAFELLMARQEVHKPIMLSSWLTGGVFLGSLVCYWYLLDPVFQAFPKFHQAFYTLYYVLWVFPVYFVCFVLNSFCYSDIAYSVFTLLHGQTRSPDLSFSRKIAYEVHRGLIMGVYLLGLSVLSLFPYTEPITLFLLSLLYSFYCFEYRWVLEGKTVNKGISVLERNVPYYFGFGLPFTLMTCFFPGFIGNGVWALLFPVFIVTSLDSDPPQASQFPRVPLFKFAHKLCSKIEILLLGK